MQSLKSRLIAAATAWIAIGMLAAGLLLSTIFKTHVTEQFYSELFVHLDELQKLAAVDVAGAHLQRNLSDPRYDVAMSGYYWEIQKSGSVLARSESLKGEALKTPLDSPHDVGVHTHQIAGPTGTLLVAERADWKSPNDQPVRYIIGTDQRHLEQILNGFNTTLAWSLTGFGLSMVVAAALLILYALSPLKQLRTALSVVRSGQSHQLHGDFPTELRPVVTDLNQLLTSTSDLIKRARTQAGNLAHGLKTPLAILADEAYRIAEKGQPQASAIVLDQCRKMQTHIDYQIARARAVAMRSTPGTVAAVDVAARDVTRALGRLHFDKGIRIENLIADASLRVACDSQDVNEMLANLADNACKHGRSVVRISADRPRAGCVRILVEDDGPGLPQEAYDVVFNVGERWDSAVQGSGLGLAIVRDLARLYGGDVTLEASSLGGLAASLLLPVPSSML
ncbi:MAG: HAMP domain-containing histidine kinase [Hyphomicrobium sp.]|nr:HAMP domain-containing histidine kinase [Hyphomicrobium sp.]